jgi:hypothetical protein
MQPAQPQSLEQWSGHEGYRDGSQGQAGVAQGGYGSLQAQDDHAPHDDEHGEYDEAAEEPPKRRRGLLVVAALIGAIGLGGALAYGYKSFLAPAGKGGTPPVVRKEATPAKTKPADPGGRQFANQDSKLLGKLGEDATRTAANASDDGSGVRRVTTMPIGRDGSIVAPPVATAAPAAPAPAGGPAVPGMILDNSFRNAAAPPSPPPAPPAAPTGQPAAPVAPRIAAAPPVAQPPLPKAPPAAPAPAADAPAAKPVAKAAAKAPKRRDDYAAAGGQATTTTAAVPAAAAPAAAAPAAAAAPKAGITGYMAVLASPKSRMEALKAFADLQQKYPDVLANKTPEVQESDQSARGLGVIYRVLVGPPGSRETASGVCQQLKTAGHSACWVTGF